MSKDTPALSDLPLTGSSQTMETSMDQFSSFLYAPVRKLDADEYTANDLDGVTESATGSGNLNFLMMQAGQTNEAMRNVNPFDNVGGGGDFHAATPSFTGNAPLGVCAFWPVPQTSKPHEIAVQGLPRTIVVSITNDPATPYQAGVDLARQLGSALITVDGNQHTIVFSDNTCVDGIVAKYLVDPAAPVADATC